MKKEVFIIPMVPKWENKCLCGLGRVKKKKKLLAEELFTMPAWCLQHLFIFLKKVWFPLSPHLFITKMINLFLHIHTPVSKQQLSCFGIERDLIHTNFLYYNHIKYALPLRINFKSVINKLK